MTPEPEPPTVRVKPARFTVPAPATRVEPVAEACRPGMVALVASWRTGLVSLLKLTSAPEIVPLTE